MDKNTHWQQQLAESRAGLLSVLDQLTPEQWGLPVYGEGEDWTIQDVVAHLVDSERGMSIHIYKIRKGRETLPETFDLNQWNAGVRERTGDVTPAQLREGLVGIREKLLEGLATLTGDEWQLTGRHPFRGVITIEQYYETITAHEQMHTDHIKQAAGKG
jgi:hypothetical protein